MVAMLLHSSSPSVFEAATSAIATLITHNGECSALTLVQFLQRTRADLDLDPGSGEENLILNRNDGSSWIFFSWDSWLLKQMLPFWERSGDDLDPGSGYLSVTWMLTITVIVGSEYQCRQRCIKSPPV